MQFSRCDINCVIIPGFRLCFEHDVCITLGSYINTICFVLRVYVHGSATLVINLTYNFNVAWRSHCSYLMVVRMYIIKCCLKHLIFSLDLIHPLKLKNKGQLCCTAFSYTDFSHSYKIACDTVKHSKYSISLKTRD